MDEASTSLAELKRDVRRLIRLTFALYVVMAIALTLGVLGYLVQRNRDNQARRAARVALCVEVEKLKLFQRQDKTGQLAQSRKYLRAHPHGAPGIPRRLIVEGITRLERQLAALRPAECQP